MDFFPGYDQYILWNPVEKPNGKFDKVPVGNHLNPANWKSFEEIRILSERTGSKIGFVFTENDPFFFVDIDGALVDDFWTPLARQICAAFPGCAIEVSQGGDGLHIFGTGVPAINHRNKNSEYNLELYTRDRFVALTWDGATGSALTNGQAGLNWLADGYFREKPSRTAAAWTTEACEGWAGSEDDEELLKIAFNSRSASAVFGGVGFKELFEADETKLSEKYPSPSGDAFDRSSADAALMSHLAFYTGKNCERMERLFNRSKLADRDKWRDRPDYRERTILNAVSVCRNVYSRGSPTDKSREAAATPPIGGFRQGFQFLDIAAQAEYFRGCAYVVSKHRVLTPAYGMLRPDQFKATYGGYQFALAAEGRPTKNAFEAFTESQLYNFPRVYGTCFRPETAQGTVFTEENLTLINTYTQISVETRAGDAEPFLDLLRKMIPDERDRQILLAYMAACVQRPGAKFQWAPLVQGAEGNGKTFLLTALSKAIGERYTHLPSASDLSGNGLKFTGWLEGKLFIGVEEIYAAGKSNAPGKIPVQEALKPFITNPRIEIQSKGVDQRVIDNRANFFFCTQYKDAIKKTQNDRRYCVYYCAQQSEGDLTASGMGGLYFPNLYGWGNGGGFAIIAGYLKNYRIPGQFDPGGACHRAPKTSSTPEAVSFAVGEAEQEVLEAIKENRLGFKGGWISSVALDWLLSEKKIRVARNKRKNLVENIGYGVKERMNVASVSDSGKRPVLYVADGSGLNALPPGAPTTEAYLKAQQEV